ncbi:MAG: hypothetical protein R3E39_08395 [Anaerolineae bacterium]
MTSEANFKHDQRSKKYWEIFLFILRWWFIYSIIGTIIFLYSLIPFAPHFCRICGPRGNLEFGNLIWTIFLSIGLGGLIGGGVGLLLGGIHAIVVGFWVYYPVADIVSFRRQVILSNIALPTGLMIFAMIVLLPSVRNIPDLLTVFYSPMIAYTITLIIGLLVSRKFLRWWLQDTATPNP